MEVPQFFYLPDKMDFDSYEIDEAAQSVYIKYENDESYMYFVIQANYKNSYYRISGKITQDEITEIVKNIMY